MTTTAPEPTNEPEPLLPPRRVGRTLARARLAAGLTSVEAAAVLPGPGGEHLLGDLESGRRPITDEELAALAGLYGLELTTGVPPRAELVVDLHEGRLASGEHTGGLPRCAGRAEVLERYLALVYAMRGVEPGERVPLRSGDLDVLAGVLDATRDELDAELAQLMEQTGGPVATRLRALSGRLLLPVVGVVVAATTVGTLLLVPAEDSSASTAPRPVASVDAPAGVAPVEIGTAAVQERLDDGTPGPVRDRD